MKYLKKFNEASLYGGLPLKPYSIMSKREKIEYLLNDGSEEKLLDFYEKERDVVLKSAGMGTNDDFPIPNYIYDLKIRLRDEFRNNIDDGIDIDQYEEEKNKKPFIQRFKDIIKKFGKDIKDDWNSPTEDMGPGNGTTHSDTIRHSDNIKKDFGGGAW